MAKHKFSFIKMCAADFLGLLIEAYCCAMDNRVNRFGAAPADCRI